MAESRCFLSTLPFLQFLPVCARIKKVSLNISEENMDRFKTKIINHINSSSTLKKKNKIRKERKKKRNTYIETVLCYDYMGLLSTS